MIAETNDFICRRAEQKIRYKETKQPSPPPLDGYKTVVPYIYLDNLRCLIVSFTVTLNIKNLAKCLNLLMFYYTLICP